MQAAAALCSGFNLIDELSSASRPDGCLWNPAAADWLCSFVNTCLQVAGLRSLRLSRECRFL